MIELPLVFAAGFLGSSHCIGMCGPFAVLLGSGSSSTANGLARQLLFSVGRIFTYSVLGAIAGFCGMYLAETSVLTGWVNVPAALSIVAGTFLIYQGLEAAGVFRMVWRANAAPCLAGGLVANFLKSPNPVSVFLAGLFTGFLPCGLVYGFLGMSASSQQIFTGAAIMCVFGLGTVPVMVATGTGGGMLSATTRGRVLRIAAWCLVIAGVISIARGVSYIGAEAVDPAACPLCP